VLPLVVCLLAIASVFAVAGSSADTTSVSSFSKSGSDPTTGSLAVSGGPAGTTRAGDTINWVLHYQNNTGANANASIAENITGNQALVGGSVKGPPNLQPKCTFPLLSSCATSPSSGGRFVASGSVIAATTGSAAPLVTVPVAFTTPGGDGYTVEGVGNQIYTVFHHSALSTTVFCATLSNQVCSGWPALSTFVDPSAGTKIGQGTSGQYATADSNGSFVSGGNLYWPVEATTAVGGTYPLGVQCLDLGTQTSCGFTQLDTATQPPASTGTAGRPVGRITADGIAAANGDYYMFDSRGQLLCFDPASGSACGAFNVTGGAPVFDPGAGALSSMITLGSHVYVTFINSSNNHIELTCFDTSTSALCGASPSPFPADDGAALNDAYPDFVAPVLAADGTPLGACDVNKHLCYGPTGAALANPYPSFSGFGYPPANTGFGSGAVVGSRFYAGDLATGKIDCFDFSARVGTGAVPACSGYTPPADAYNYTVRPLASLPGCLAADGDAGQIVVFNGQTGGQCQTATAQTSATPASYYCDGQGGHAQHWGSLTMQGLTGSEYQSATLTLVGPNGPVPGYTNLLLAPNQTSVDLSSLPVSGDTASLTAEVTLTGVTNTAAVNASSLILTWSGDPIQICFQTKVGPSTCEPTPVISNNATATTSAISGGGGDSGTGGNNSGTVTFNEAPDTSQCQPSVSITKIASAGNGDQTPIRRGEQINYSYLVTNTGNVSIPTISISDPKVTGISCPTPAAPGLAPGASETCTAAPYVVTQADVDAGGVTNTASVSCADRYGDPCPSSPKSSTHVPSKPDPSVAIDKQATVTPAADQSGAKVGDSIQYTYRVTNTGNVDEASISVSDPSAGKVACPVPASPGLAPGASETCTAVVTHTVTQAEVDAGSVVDTATASCKDSQGNSCPPSTPSKVTVPTVTPDPQTSIQKIANASGGDQAPITAGETIQYSYLVRNTGNITLTSVSVDDPTAGSVSCPTPAAPGLAPGQSVLCTANSPYTVTQADVDAGSVTDTATSSCVAVSGGQCGISPPSTVTVPGQANPEIAIDKSAVASPASDAGALKVGDTVSYSYRLTNVGNVSLASVGVSDPSLGAVSCPGLGAQGLAPGAAITCTSASTHTVSQADVDAGSVTDSATASCKATNGAACGPSNKSTVTLPTTPAAPLASVHKLAHVSPRADQQHARVGDKISYTYEVTNVGNVDLMKIEVSDPSIGRVICPRLPATGLAVRKSVTCHSVRKHVVTVRDAKAGVVRDVAVATGTDPRGQVSAVSAQSKVANRVVGGGLVLRKTASASTVVGGHDVTYTLVVSNPTKFAAVSVDVCDALPAGLNFVGATPVARTHAEQRCWSLKRLGSHQSRRLRITANVALTHGARITNHATASAHGVKTVHASATITVKPVAISPCVSGRAAAGSRGGHGHPTGTIAC
jgi:uncharacterized repeat protein (TIGR01451 family)